MDELVLFKARQMGYSWWGWLCQVKQKFKNTLKVIQKYKSSIISMHCHTETKLIKLTILYIHSDMTFAKADTKSVVFLKNLYS